MRHTRTLVIVGCAVALASAVGCTRIHIKEPVQIEVIDAISLEPVPDARVEHGVPTSKFERELRENGTTDASGIASIDSIRLVDDAWWCIRRGNAAADQWAPYYEGAGWSQMPPEFTLVASGVGRTRYRAPLWPDIRVAIDVPAGYRGIVAWNAVEADVGADSGWLPPEDLRPARLHGDEFYRAIARPNDAGAVAHPTSVAGVPGYKPTSFEPWTSPAISMDGQRMNVVDSDAALNDSFWCADSSMNVGGSWEPIPMDNTLVRAWRLRAHRIRGAPDRYWGPEFAWFIGSLDDLRTWAAARELTPLDRYTGRPVDSGDPAATRVYAAGKLLPLIPVAKSPSPPPSWRVERVFARRY